MLQHQPKIGIHRYVKDMRKELILKQYIWSAITSKFILEYSFFDGDILDAEYQLYERINL